MRLIILGLPGSGKGSQSKLISKQFGIPQISTGDILRRAVKEGMELGDKARSYMERGQLVPDALMTELVIQRLEKEDCQQGFILDGFPRTINQAETLDDLLKEKNMALDSVLELQVSDEAVIQRLSNRRLCSRCTADYNLLSNPPKERGICDQCGGSLYQREDDREETIARRLQVYHLQTKPLETYYKDKDVLRIVDAGKGVEEVSSEISDTLRSLPRVASAKG
ncbi:adenylate kinase [bacterium]|nr:adenylate kinase [bacterium]